MKKLLAILVLLIPNLLMAQKDSMRQTFRIGHCAAYVAGLRGGKISRAKLLGAKKINIEWCTDTGRVTGFELVIQYSTKESYALVDKPAVVETKPSKSEYFTDEMLADIRKAPKGASVFISKIIYGWNGDTSEKLGSDIELVIQ